jgi:predicted HTH domain antitoxin
VFAFDSNSCYHTDDLADRAISDWVRREEFMSTITIALSDDLSTQLEPYRDQLDTLLRVGLREMKMAQALALYKQGDLSLWKTARLAGVSLREMVQYAIAQGVRAVADEETLREELA